MPWRDNPLRTKHSLCFVLNERYKVGSHLRRLTLQAPQLQHQGAALQVAEQTLGCVEGAEVDSVLQLRVDVVPHCRCEQSPAAFEQPETDPAEENRLRMSFFFCFVTQVQ